MANGEKVPPADMEMAIALDTLFEQVMIIGDNRPYLTAMIVLNEEQWAIHAKNLGLDSSDPDAPAAERFEKLVCEKITTQLSEFPGYAIIRQVTCVLEPWTIENELITPTLKLKRNRIMERFETDVEKMYEGH